jgi:hypothetical protein
LFILNNFQILTKKSIIMSINVYEQLVHLIFYNNKLVGYDFPFWNCFYVFNYFFCQTIVKCGNCHNFLPIIFTLKSDLKKKRKEHAIVSSRTNHPDPFHPHIVYFFLNGFVLSRDIPSNQRVSEWKECSVFNA